jgi:glutamate 5-kinase
MSRSEITTAKRIVIKIGSALLTNDGAGLDKEAIAGWVDQIAELKKKGLEIVLVSSGSVAEGMTRLGWDSRPTTINELQAAAAIGQMGLVHCYESNFTRHNYLTAQILLTHADLSNRTRYLNARSAIRTLI